MRNERKRAKGLVLTELTENNIYIFSLQGEMDRVVFRSLVRDLGRNVRGESQGVEKISHHPNGELIEEALMKRERLKARLATLVQ